MTESRCAVDPLQQLVLTRLAELGTPGKPMSARAAARRSDGAVSYDTLYAIANGKHTGRLAPGTPEGIALALDVPVSRVYDAAGAPRAQGSWQPGERLDRLSLEQRKALEEMGNMILRAYEDGYSRGRDDALRGSPE